MIFKRAVEDTKKILDEIKPENIIEIEQSITPEERTVFVRYIVREEKVAKFPHLNCRCDIVTKWWLSQFNDYMHHKGPYTLTRYLANDYWRLTKGDIVIGKSLSAKIGYKEAQLWADCEIRKYERKQSSVELLGSDW